MFTISNYDYDCTKKCQCKDHGHIITSALTRKSIPEEILAAFIAKTCKNFMEVLDFEGRSSLHIACSVDQYRIAEWLLNHGALINTKDFESGNSALHRAIFYGCIDCAVLLLRYGASIDIPDNDFRNPLQYICKPGGFSTDISEKNDVLVWGTNKNYNLALSSAEETNYPQFINFFRKQDISIKTLAISTFHSLFLDKIGRLYAVGHGKGGRLGIGSENSLPAPKRLRLPTKNPEEHGVVVSCSKNHSLVLTNLGIVYSCGLNSDQQLGIKPPIEKSTSFKEICTFSQNGVKNLVGVIANDHHSVAYNNQHIYIWGANRGQFGTTTDSSHILLPTILPLHDRQITYVKSSNSAIVCYTACIRHIFLFHNFKMKSIKTPNLESLLSVTINDAGKSNKNSTEGILRLIVLTASKCIYIWYDDIQQYVRGIYSLTKHLQVDEVLLKANKMLILAGGDLYQAKINKMHVHNDTGLGEYRETYTKKDISTKFKLKIDLKRVPFVDRVIGIFCDDEFESFAILQESSQKYYQIPQIITEELTFENLLHEVTEFDAIHDIVFHVDNEVFPSHKLIVFTRSRGLMKIVQQFYDKNIYLNFKNFSGKMFEFILKYIYTNYSLSLKDLDDIQQSIDPDFQRDRWEICDIFLSFLIKFELNEFANSLKRLNNNSTTTKSRFTRFKRTSFCDLHDVTIKCAGGNELCAHKCVLMARLEYFRLMFNNTWSESNVINFTTIPFEYMNPIIEFVYTADANYFRKQKYSETFLYNMIVICDQLLINQLKKICEILILEKISIRKCGEILEFACEYNCELLEKNCLDYICQNLARILEQKSLENCSPEVLKRINKFYRKVYRTIFDYRVITPHFNDFTEDELIKYASDFSVDLKYKMDENLIKGKLKGKTKMNKSEMYKRNYEREAISSMKLLDISLTKIDKNQSDKLENKKKIEEICDKIESKSETWMKVIDKKESKKLSSLSKINEILQVENKPKEDFINLNEILNSGKGEKTADKEEVTPPNRPNFNFGDFTPKKIEKLSQKQKKRLSSESNQETIIIKSKPIEIPQSSNPWNLSQSVPGEQSTSFAEIMKSPSPSKLFITPPEKCVRILPKPKGFQELCSPSSTISRQNVSSCFTQILEDERKQKEYFDKIKHKSLILTQIEEAAIDELKLFYNVDNVFDEEISIERKYIQATTNFAVWQHN